MPPCLDVYVWVRTDDRSGALSRFIDRHVDVDNPGDPRFDAFVRAFLAREPIAGDHEALAELRQDESAVDAFSLYLDAKAHYEAIVTITEEGDLVLGLGLDDPDNDPETVRSASDAMATLKQSAALKPVVKMDWLPIDQLVPVPVDPNWASERVDRR